MIYLDCFICLVQSNDIISHLPYQSSTFYPMHTSCPPKCSGLSTMKPPLIHLCISCSPLHLALSSSDTNLLSQSLFTYPVHIFEPFQHTLVSPFSFIVSYHTSLVQCYSLHDQPALHQILFSISYLTYTHS